MNNIMKYPFNVCIALILTTVTGQAQKTSIASESNDN